MDKTTALYIPLRDEMHENIEFLVQQLSIKIFIQFDHEMKHAKAHTQQRYDREYQRQQKQTKNSNNDDDEEDDDDVQTRKRSDPAMERMVLAANEYALAVDDARDGLKAAQRKHAREEDIAWHQQTLDKAQADRDACGRRTNQQTNMFILEQYQKNIYAKQWNPEWFANEMVRDFTEEEYGHMSKVVRDVVVAHRRVMFWTKVADDDAEDVPPGAKLLARLCCETLSIARYSFLNQLGLFSLDANTQLRAENRARQMSIVEHSLRSAVRIISGGIVEACDFPFTEDEAVPEEEEEEKNDRRSHPPVAMISEEEREQAREREQEDAVWKENLLAESQRNSRMTSNLQRPLEIVKDMLEDLCGLARERDDEKGKSKAKCYDGAGAEHLLQQLVDLAETTQQQQRDVWMRQARQMEVFNDALEGMHKLVTKLSDQVAAQFALRQAAQIQIQQQQQHRQPVPPAIPRILVPRVPAPAPAPARVPIEYSPPEAKVEEQQYLDAPRYVLSPQPQPEPLLLPLPFHEPAPEPAPEPLVEVQAIITPLPVLPLHPPQPMPDFERREGEPD